MSTHLNYVATTGVTRIMHSNPNSTYRIVSIVEPDTWYNTLWSANIFIARGIKLIKFSTLQIKIFNFQ